MAGIIILGLGPGRVEKITQEAWDVLSTASEVWLRTQQHPCVLELPKTTIIKSFDRSSFNLD